MGRTNEPKRRPGGRTARVGEAVLAAALEELIAVGRVGLTVEGIARRAQVSKRTIYRRWGTIDALLLDVIAQQTRDAVPIPDTGSLRTDLVRLATAVMDNAASPEIQAIVRAALPEITHSEAVAAGARAFWSERIEHDSAIITRAVARGEIPESTDARLVIESLLGPLHLRLFLLGENPDKKVIEAAADLVVRALGAPAGN